MRLLDIAGISYIEREYDESIVNGIQVAEALKEDVDCVFKTLVVENQKKEHFVFCVPVAKELDLKKAASSVNEKYIKMIQLFSIIFKDPLTSIQILKD